MENTPAAQLKATGFQVTVISGGDIPHAHTRCVPNSSRNKCLQTQTTINKLPPYFAKVKLMMVIIFLIQMLGILLSFSYDTWPAYLMSILLRGMWHAGSYDPQDFLGRLIGNEPWVRNAEKSLFSCYNDNSATQFLGSISENI